jgi:hypothetical protein
MLITVPATEASTHRTLDLACGNGGITALSPPQFLTEFTKPFVSARFLSLGCLCLEDPLDTSRD